MTESARALGELVLGLGAPIALAKGETLFHEGDPSNSVYACRSGLLQVTVSAPSGTELVLGWKQPGDGFGELSAIDGRPRSARILAVVDSELAVLGRADFFDALRRAPEVAVGMLVELSDHLRRANTRATERGGAPVAASVGQRLVELSAQLRRHGRPDAPVELPITQEDLARWAGTTRESAARALAVFRDQGLIETSRGRIRILDGPGLESAVAGMFV